MVVISETFDDIIVLDFFKARIIVDLII